MKLFNFTTYGLLRRRILDVSNGIDEPGEIRLPLATTLLIAWIAVFFCIHKGRKTRCRKALTATGEKENTWLW